MATSRLCQIDGCDKKHHAKGFCKKHLYKFNRYGDGSAGRELPPRGEPLAFLFGLLNDRREECVYWPYSPRGKFGYGGVFYEGRMDLAHRIGCEWVNGPPTTKDHEAAHNCGQGREGCVNPYHTRWATPKENAADQVAHGTRRCGDKISTTKLTPDAVRSLRRDIAGGATQVATALKYAISRRQVRAIIDGRYWTWVA